MPAEETRMSKREQEIIAAAAKVFKDERG